MRSSHAFRSPVALPLVATLLAAFVPAAFAGFASTEVFLPAVGRAPGNNGAQIYSTVWATNLTQATETFTFHFLQQGQSNATASLPIARANEKPGGALASTSFSDTLLPGETKIYENVVETKLGLSNAIGAARIVSSGEIFVAERIFNQTPGDDLGATQGMFFAGVPKAFSISSGQSASVQGVNQGGSENFRSNFALVETGGGNPTVNVQVFDGSGTLLGQKAYPLLPYELILPSVADVVPGIATINARITVTVTGGTGSVLLALAQVANESQDSSGFEMSFRDALLGGGGGGCTLCVTSLNGLTGAVTLAAGSGITLTPTGQTITIAANGAGGLTLPFTGAVASTSTGFAIFQTGTGAAIQGSAAGGAIGVYGNSASGPGVSGTSTTGFGVVGSSASGGGVQGTSTVNNAAGVAGINTSGGNGIFGQSKGGIAVFGHSDQGIGIVGDSAAVAGVTGTANSATHGGVEGTNSGNGFGVFGQSQHGYGVYGVSGDAAANAGVAGVSSSAYGVLGSSSSSWGVYGIGLGTGVNGAAVRADGNGIGLFATNDSDSDSAIVATNASSSGYVFKGFGAGGAVQAFFVTSAGEVSAHGSFHAGGIDYADRLAAEDALEPGDVVAIGPDGILRKTSRPSDPSVAGVYSTKPGVEGRDESERRATMPLALAGVIPVKVSTENGPIRPGMLLVSSSTPGRAMRAPEDPAPGTVIGKAMGGAVDPETQTVPMLVMLR